MSAPLPWPEAVAGHIEWCRRQPDLSPRVLLRAAGVTGPLDRPTWADAGNRLAALWPLIETLSRMAPGSEASRPAACPARPSFGHLPIQLQRPVPHHRPLRLFEGEAMTRQGRTA